MKDLSVSLVAANLYSLLLIVPLLVVLAVPYGLLWGTAELLEVVEVLVAHPFYALAALVVGIIVHEGLHGVTWRVVGSMPAQAIHYGVKALTPYAHCTEPMDIGAYRWGAAMPGLVLGILPAALGIATMNPEVMAFGLFFTLAAGGDALILWLLRTVEPGRLVQDHPERAGCLVLEADASHRS